MKTSLLALVVLGIGAGIYFACLREEEEEWIDMRGPYFHPQLSLKWPGEHHEPINGSHTHNKNADLTWSDRFKVDRDGGTMLYTAEATEFTRANIAGKTDQDMLESPLRREGETIVNKTDFAHGANRFPAIDVLSHANGKHIRRVVVLARPTLYEVAVTSSKLEWLDLPEVDAFLKSLHVESADTSRNRTTFLCVKTN